MLPIKIEITHKTVLFTIAILLGIYLLYHVLDIILLVFVAFIFMSAFKPIVDTLESKKIPRVLGALLVYVIFISLVVLLITSLLPPVISETGHLIERLPLLLRSIFPFLAIDTQTLTSQIAPLSQNLVTVTIGVFSNVFTIFSVLVISFYLVLERKHLDVYLRDFVGNSVGDSAFKVIEDIELRLGAWVRGQLMMGLVIGLATFAALTFLNLPYSLPLAIFAGIMELVPIIGPIISMIPSTLIAVTISPFLAALTILSYLIIQQVEAHIVVPIMMRKVVGLPPLITILALMVGARLNGIVGALLAVPILLTFLTISSSYLNHKKRS